MIAIATMIIFGDVALERLDDHQRRAGFVDVERLEASATPAV